MIFIYQKILSAKYKQRLSFEKAKVEVERLNRIWTWLGNSMTLYFLEDKVEVFMINIHKDGLPVETLDQIVQTADSLSMPIINIK